LNFCGAASPLNLSHIRSVREILLEGARIEGLNGKQPTSGEVGCLHE